MRRPSMHRVSLATIAAEAGVSVSTVSRIVNGQLDRANPQTVDRVRALIETLGYRPNTVGQALRRRESRVVAMLAPNLDNPAMGAIATSTEAALRAAGYVMILCDTHDEPELQDEYLEAMRAQFVQGYVLVSTVASPGLIDFLARGEPAVLVGRRQPAVAQAVPFVGIDNARAGADAADFLLASGVAEPALLHSSLTSSAIADRVAGFTRRLQEHGARGRIAASEKLQHLEAGYDAASKLVATGGWPCGLLCVSDLMAYGAYRLAIEQQVRVPEACLMMGVDENPLNAWVAPWLSSVHVPYTDFGAAIVSQLQASWAGEPAQDRLLPHRIVNRANF